jgi:predicted acetyltransferase
MRNLGETIWDQMAARPSETPADFVHRLLSAETSPQPRFVPESIYWATSGDHVVGRIALRHELTPDLEVFGGHIGYEVRPSSRREGVATEMLRQILGTPKARQIGRLLLTCSPDNLASIRTITNNAGVLQKTAWVEQVQRDTCYFWITVGSVQKV